MKRASIILLLFYIPMHYQCAWKKTNHPAFINSRYVDARPLVQLINMGNFSELSQSFSLAADEDIQIYAVGEIFYNLPDSMKKYYLEGDDIELFFAKNKQLIFSYGDDKKKFIPPGVIFKWKNIDDVKYISEIQIPWSVLGIQKPVSDTVIGFDIGIGDNDDGFMQKSKLTWQSSTDCMSTDTSSYGKLYLTNKQAAGKDTVINRLLSVKNAPVIDGLIENSWSESPAYPIKNIAYGTVKDKYDQSARVRSCWNDSCLYFLFEVDDSRQKKLILKKLKDRNIFIDYGWIENEKGDTTWEMHPKHSTYAGGAFKNQKVDTILHLNKGNYTVKYITDESHSWNNWVLAPPQTPFYGIVIYKRAAN